MSGGGGGGGMAPPPTYTDPINGQTFNNVQALNEEIANREAQAKQKSDDEIAAGSYRQVDNRQQYDRDLVTAQSNARERASDYLRSQGYDPNQDQFSSYINREIQRATSTINNPFVADGNASTARTSAMPQISSAFDPNLGASILSSVNSGYASKANSQLDGIFTPGFAQNTVNDSWLDPAVNDVVSKQFNPLNDALSNAHKRGTLNDTGYQAALDSLTGKQSTARSTVSNLGRNILSSDRNGLNDYITNARGDANRITANTQGMFNPETYRAGATGLADSYRNNFGGDLTNAVGETSFADLPGLLNAGGLVQGAADPTATNPNSGGGVSDSYIAQQALANQKRGLGTTGAF